VSAQCIQTARTACRSSSYIIEQMSSDSEVEDILLRTPTLDKLRTLDRLSTDALDPVPDSLQAASGGGGGGLQQQQVRQPRPRDRQQRRGAFSPLLDSTERDHYSVCQPSAPRHTSHSRHVHCIAICLYHFVTCSLTFYSR